MKIILNKIALFLSTFLFGCIFGENQKIRKKEIEIDEKNVGVKEK